MEKLTEKKDNGHYYLIGCPDFYISRIVGFIIQTSVDKLGAIEDILGDDYDLDRLRELVQADRDGRCVALPCKVGDTVYEIRYAAKNERKAKHARKKFDCSVSACTWRMKVFPEKCYVAEKKCTKSDFTYMGKTVFLTREAAEAALKGEQDG